jgi:hypothetical protein
MIPPFILATGVSISGYNMHTGRIYLETMSKKPSTIFLTPPVVGGFLLTAILPLHHYGTKIIITITEKVYMHILLDLPL